MSTKILTVEGDSNTTIELMIESALKSAKENSYVGYLANRIKSLPTDQQLPALYQFVRSMYTFVPDVTEQTIRTARALMDDNLGNCVDASVFVSSVLIYMGIPHELRFYAQDEQSGYNHVFVVARKNVILDTILGKPGSGTEKWFDNIEEGYFNTSIPEFHKQTSIQII